MDADDRKKKPFPEPAENGLSAAAVLELKTVHAAYGHIQALNGISMRVAEREVVAMIGANGAGKSTVLRCVSGLVRVQRGEIFFRGRRIDGMPPQDIAALGIGHVPEGRRIFQKLTVDENLEMGAYLEPDRKLVTERKELVWSLFPRLAERRKQRGGTLSGGEQQMLAIGRALMQDPALLLLDEPTMGLAPVLVDVIFESLRSLRKAGKTMLLVEQNAWQALRLADRAYVLQTGSIVLHGPAHELADDPTVKASYLGG